VTEPALFIRLYLDEDVSVFVAQLLRPHGFDVLTTKDAQKLGSTDAAQLRYAATQRFILLTHNVSISNASTLKHFKINSPTPASSSPIAAPRTSS
jgi:hypothetical protein